MAVLVAAQSVKSALARLLIGMAGVYTLQSLIGGLMNASLPTFLRNQGLGLDAIGLLSVLMLTEYYGWRNAINYLALVGFVLGLLFIASAGLHTSGTHAGETNQSLNDHSDKPSLWRALKRPEIQTGLLFVTLAQLGLRLTIGLSGPFMIDQGFAMSDIGSLASTYGFFFSLLSIYITGLANQASFAIAATASAILLVSFTALLNRIHHNIQQGRL